jgi:CheY-like chemotaxis protein
LSRSRKHVLVVDDEPAVRALLWSGLGIHLPEHAIATAADGREAVEHLSRHPVDVVVTDVNMPVMDGFELLAHIRNRHPNVPVLVLATMAPESVRSGTSGLGSFRVLRKPTSPAVVAQHIRDAIAETVRGRMPDVSLAPLLRLVQLERKTCSLLVRSPSSKGRLHFLSGELVDAYSFELDAVGEVAARHLLALDRVTIEFERSLHNDQRRIETPLEALLLGAAVDHDERTRSPVERPPAASVSPWPDLDHALDRVRSALAALQDRSEATARLLGERAVDLERSVADLARIEAPGALADETLTVAWHEVSALAARLVAAAETLDEANRP